MHSVQFAVLCIMNITVSSQYARCLLLKQPMLFTQVCILVPGLTELCMASGLDVDGTYLGNDCINLAPNGAGAKSFTTTPPFHKTADQKQNKPIHRE